MAFKLNKVFTPVVKLVSGGSSSGTRKKTYKYQVKVKGTTISKHYTKKNADTASRSISGARVSKIGSGYAKAGYAKARKPSRRY